MNINLTLIGQAISFALFVWFCMQYVWPPLMEALEARTKTIADGLAAAERGQHEKELAQKRATESLKEAKEQAAGILAQAQKQASEIVEASKSDARTEGERLIVAAQSEIEQELSRAKENLRQQVAGIAIAGAEKILKKEIKAADHGKVLDDLIAQI